MDSEAGFFREEVIGAECSHDVEQKATDAALAGVLKAADVFAFIVHRLDHGSLAQQNFFARGSFVSCSLCHLGDPLNAISKESTSKRASEM